LSGVLRINVWSGPRNISTALMYCFAQRADTHVVDEPLYAHYLSHSSAHEYHPGAEVVLRSQDNDGEAVVRDIILGPCDRPVLFLKQMTHHLVELDLDFLAETANVILTRDPADMLPSYQQQVATPTLADTGYPQHHELLTYLRARGQKPVILDARETLRNPRSVLSQLCEHMGIDFDDRMLQWEAGPRPEDGAWAPHWYARVHRSTGFAAYRPKSEPFQEKLQPLLERCRPLYEELAAAALRG
jgi:hypothetical protein